MALSAWIRTACVVVAAALAGCGAATTCADDNSDDAVQIAVWIEQLDSDRYFVREDATRRLYRAGESAVEALETAAGGSALEAKIRALEILGRLCLSDDAATRQAAESVMDRLAESADRSVSARAKAALVLRNMSRRATAIQRLGELGAKVQMYNGLWLQVQLTADWKGQRADLEQLRWLTDLQSLSVQDVELDEPIMRRLAGMQKLVAIELNDTGLSDDGLAHLADLPELQIVQLANVDLTDAATEHLERFQSRNARIALFGTQISREASAKLSAARPDLIIDRRDGALLGVSGLRDQNACIVETVRPGTAAFNAGIQLGDVITHFDDQQVGDFAELTAMIAHKKPGDKVTLKVRRGTEVFDREITFGSW